MDDSNATAILRQRQQPALLVTNLKAESKCLFDRLYFARGEMENRTK